MASTPYTVSGVICPACRTPLLFIEEDVIIDGESHPAVSEMRCNIHGDKSEAALRQLKKSGRYSEN